MEPVEWFLAEVDPPGGTSNQFIGTWYNLAATDNDGNPYTYFFTEDIEHNAEKLQNYERSYTDYITVNDVQYAKNNTTVINTYVPPMDGTATAIKQWINGKAVNHEPVDMTLWRSTDNGITMEKITGVNPAVDPEAGPADTFTYTWSNLQRTDNNGVAYQFYFKENIALPEGYSLSYSASTTGDNTGYAPSGATAYNTYTSPQIDVTAKKIWENGLKADHKAVPLTLYRKIEGGELQPVTATYTVSAPVEDGRKTEFTYTWAGVDKTDINGNVYTYYFKEDTVSGYTRIYDAPYETDYGLAGTAVTNEYIQPTVTVDGSKVWMYGNQALGRPVVYIKLQRSINGIDWEDVPNAEPIKIDESTLYTPYPAPPDSPLMFTTTFSWDYIHQKSEEGIQYLFNMNEVDKDGVDLTPAGYEKFESSTSVYNVYQATGSFTPQVTKKLAGRTLKADEFSFELKDSEDTVLQTKKNAANGDISFDSIPYTQADIGNTYTYTITEVIPASVENGMDYDLMEVEITVEINDSGLNDGTPGT